MRIRTLKVLSFQCSLRIGPSNRFPSQRVVSYHAAVCGSRPFGSVRSKILNYRRAAITTSILVLAGTLLSVSEHPQDKIRHVISGAKRTALVAWTLLRCVEE